MTGQSRNNCAGRDQATKLDATKASRTGQAQHEGRKHLRSQQPARRGSVDGRSITKANPKHETPVNLSVWQKHQLGVEKALKQTGWS